MFKMKTMVLTITIVVLALFLAGNHALAATFSDVPANHWAKSYIDRCTSEGIIKGYPDNTFRPSNEISFTEISSLLSGLLNVTESEMQAANTTYGQKIIQLNVPDWARPAVLKCLYKGVYSLSNLETAASAGMLDDTKGMAVSRANCAVFFSQAMGLSSQMGTTGLTYHDLNSISESARPHIVALQKVGVLSAQGDGYGYFHPMNGIDRASIAKMLTVAIDYLKKNPGTTPTPTPTVSIKTVSGHVKNISSFGGQNYIIITKSDGKDEAYSIDVSTKVTVDTLPAFVTQIKEGMEATLTYDDTTKKAATGIFKTAEKKIEGIIKEMPRWGSKVDVEYTTGSITKTEEFNFSGATITLDGSKADFEDLRQGCEVIIHIKGDKVTKVEAKKSKLAADGYFYSFEKYRNREQLRLSDDSRLSYRSLKDYDLSDRVYVNGKLYTSTELVSTSYKNVLAQGVPVKLRLDSRDRVTEIETVFDATISDGEIWAYVDADPKYKDTDIRVSSTQYNPSRDQLAYIKLADRISVYKGNKTMYVENLRRGDWVKITMYRGEAERIEVLETSWNTLNSIASGECYDVNTTTRYIDLVLDDATRRNTDFNSYSEYFYYDNSTSFYNGTTKLSGFTEFHKLVRIKSINGYGSTLDIEYKKNGSIFEAVKVTIK